MLEIIKTPFIRLLKPIVWFAIRHSLKFREFEEMAKQAFVELAEKEMLQLDQTITISKLSVITGIQRKDIKRLCNKSPSVNFEIDFITKIIGLWQNNKKFCDRSGKPRILSFKNRQGDFVKLVSKVSTDLNPYTVLFELDRAGIAKNTEAGIQLIKPAYQPQQNLKESLRLLAEDSEYLHKAVSENIFSAAKENNLHIKTEYDNIPVCFGDEIRSWFLQKGADFHQQIREYLSQFDRDINPTIKSKYPDEASIRAVLGTYSLTEEVKKEIKSS